MKTFASVVVVVAAVVFAGVQAHDTPVRRLRVAKQDPAPPVMETPAMWLRENAAKMESQWGGNIKPHAAKMEAHDHKPAKMEAHGHNAYAKSETESHAVRAIQEPRANMEGQRVESIKGLINKIKGQHRL